jgi:hypothetical protein
MMHINNSLRWRRAQILRFGWLCLGLCVWMVPAPALAVPVADLYVAEVLVTSQDKNQLTRGARAGLLQVLVRISGAKAVENHPLVVASLRRPEQYYYQYSYESTDRSFQIGDEIVPARILRLSFEPSAVSRLLRQAGFPIWGDNRPSMLVWMVVNDGAGRRLLAEQDPSPLLTALNTQARLRGLPIFYPLMDLEDASRLSTAEVWGAFLSKLEQASYRYHPDAILSGRIQQDSTDQWSGFWTYRYDDRWYEFSNTGFSEDNLMAGVVDHVADAMALTYALDSTRGTIDVHVEGVETLADYAALSRYLQSLSPVVDDSVIEVSGNEILFRLMTEGQSQQLIEIIGLDEKMQLINRRSAIDGSDSQLYYRWL